MSDNPLCLLLLLLIPVWAGIIAVMEWYMPPSWKERAIRAAFGRKVDHEEGGKTVDVSKGTGADNALQKMRSTDSIH